MECGSEASAHAEASASALQTCPRAAPLSHAVGEGLGVRANDTPRPPRGRGAGGEGYHPPTLTVSSGLSVPSSRSRVPRCATRKLNRFGAPRYSHTHSALLQLLPFLTANPCLFQ